MRQDLKDYGQQAPDELTHRARQVGIEVETHLNEGRAGPMIVSKAE
ncbi:MAG: hypothetical protein IT305_32395 [Chloroflexi bacterium]|nr:hypothetical protein [Chloroflexota bacterium]